MFEMQESAPGTLRLKGRLDAAEADRAQGRFAALAGPVTLDCSELDYISSAGIGVVIETYKRLTGAGHTLRFVNLMPRVRNVFAYAGLDRILDLD